MLLSINEKKKWRDPDSLNADDRKRQDEEIFQTARLVNCGHFMALIFGDYVAGFLGLTRDGCTWSMNPFDIIHKTDSPGDLVSRGTGNHVSVEFNVLYRWHATTAQKDIIWTEDEMKRLFRGKALDELDLMDFKVAVKEAFSTTEPDPRKRTFSKYAFESPVVILVSESFSASNARKMERSTTMTSRISCTTRPRRWLGLTVRAERLPASESSRFWA